MLKRTTVVTNRGSFVQLCLQLLKNCIFVLSIWRLKFNEFGGRVIIPLGKFWKYLKKFNSFLTNFNSTWGVKGLIVTWSNLIVTWKFRPQMGIISSSPLGLRWCHPCWLYFGSFLQLNFQFVPKEYIYIYKSLGCFYCNQRMLSVNLIKGLWWSPTKGRLALVLFNWFVVLVLRLRNASFSFLICLIWKCHNNLRSLHSNVMFKVMV